MNTHTNEKSYVRKLTPLFIVPLLTLSGLLFLLPLAPAHAAVISNGGPVLGVVHQTGPDTGPTVTFANAGCNSIGQPPGCTPNELFVNATAGNLGAYIGWPDGSTGNLTIFFSVGATNLITVGAEFWLYLSTNGVSGAGLTAGDVKYAGPFLGSWLDLSLKGYDKGFGNVNQDNGTYYIGKTPGATCLGTSCRIVEGPLPIKIPAGFQFIKVYDGTTVAAYQYLTISPGIRLSPTHGPAGTPVTVTGGSFAANTLIDLNYSYSFYPWSGAAPVLKHGQWKTGLSTKTGWFNYTIPMLDTKQSVNTLLGPPDPPNEIGIHDVVTITAVKHTYPHKLLANKVGEPMAGIDATAATFIELSREFTQVISFNQNKGLVVNDTAFNDERTYFGNNPYYGNNSGHDPIISFADSATASPPNPPCPLNRPDCSNQPIPVYATGNLWVAGRYWCYGGAVSFWVSNSTDAAPAASTFNPFSPATAPVTGSKAKFGVNLTVPTNLVEGLHVVKVACDNVYYTFQIFMEPTLILTPNSGTASNPRTQVHVSAYGFPGNVGTFVYWNETYFGDNTEYNLLNATTNGLGQYEGQPTNASLTFWVPETYGGPHNVTAFIHNGDCSFQGATFNNGVDGAFFAEYYFFCGIAQTQFTVLPSFVVIPGTFNATYGGVVVAEAEGLIPGVFYSVNIDNQMADFSTTFVNFPTSFNFVTTTVSTGTSTSVTTSGGTTITITSTFTSTLTTSGGTTVSCTRSTGSVCHHTAGADPAPPFLTAPLHGLVGPNNQGRMNLTFYGAGFRPGLHVVSINPEDAVLGTLPTNVGGGNGNYAPTAHAFFTVTTAGDAIANMLVAIQNTLTGIQTSLTNIQTSLTNIQSSITSLSTSVSNLQTSVNTLTTNVSNLQTSVNGLGSSLSSLSSMVSSISSKVDTISSSVTSLQSSVSSLSTKVDTISTNVGGISGLASTANSILSAVQTEQTYLLVAIVLVAITLVLVLAVLVRKLS